MAFHGRDHKKEKHSPEELLPLTTEQLAEEQEEASHVEPPAASEGQPVTSGGEQPESANGLRSILTEPNLSWQPARTNFLDVRPDDSTMHPSFSHDDMNKMFESPRKFSLADLISNSEVVEAASVERKPSKPSLSEYYHVDESDYSSHRRFSFPHTHQPLRSMSSRLLKSGGIAGGIGSSSLEKAILKKKRKKKKKKKKKKKVRSYPSRNAIQSPTIPEEDEEDEDDSDDSEGSEESFDIKDRIVEEESQFVGSPVHGLDSPDAALADTPVRDPVQEQLSEASPVHREASPGHRVASPRASPGHTVAPLDQREASPEHRVTMPDHMEASPDHREVSPVQREATPDRLSDHRPSSAEPVFFLGGEMLGDAGMPEGGSCERKLSDGHLVKVPSVAAQRFKRNVSEEPTASPMFSDISAEEPRRSEHAASLYQQVGSGHSSGSMGHRGSEDSGTVRFTVGGDYSLPKMDENEGAPPWVPQSETESVSSSGTTTPPPAPKPMKRVPSTESTRSKHRHHHRHEHFRQQDLNMRRQKGSEVHLHDTAKSSPTEVDEAELLPKADLDQMSSHRFAELPGMRRSKIAKRKGTLHSIVHVGKVHKEKRERIKKRTFDHSPHEVFVELDELHMSSDTELEWREKARWIKFEEDVEEGAERWGKPHVASLSFHSLLELRRGLEQGVLLLDLEASDLPAIVNAVVDKLVTHDLLADKDRGKLMRTLLLKHKHVSGRSAFLQRTKSYANLVGLDSHSGQRHQHEKSLIKTFSHSSFGSSTGLHCSTSHVNSEEKKKETGGVDKNSSEEKEKAKLELVKVDVDNNMAIGDELSPGEFQVEDHVIFRESYVHLSDKLTDGVHIGLVPLEQQKKHVQDIMRRIPAGSEVSTVLVGQVDYMVRPALAFVRLAEGQFLENLTEVPLPVRFVFVLLGPDNSGMDYHEVGRSISTLMSNQAFHDVAYQAESRDELLQAINHFLDDSIVLPPGDWDQKTLLPIMDMARKRAQIRRRNKQKEKTEMVSSGRGYSGLKRALDKLSATLMEKGSSDIPVDPLKRTGRPFGGLVNDIKRRYPHYISDLRDGLNFKCLMASIFIFFACISPCIAFGGLLDEKTQGLMGVTETIVCTSISGMLFSLFCGQPLLLIGPTGPVLVFEQSLYNFTLNYGVEFLPMRCWIGLFVAIISIITVALEGSFLVRFVTRFAEEIFAILISIIFIYEVVLKLVHTFKEHPLVSSYNCPSNDTDGLSSVTSPYNISVNDSSLYNNSYYSLAPPTGNNSLELVDQHESSSHLYHKKVMPQPNTALLSLILTIGTFLIAYFLRIFRNSRFLGRSVRRALGDFGVLIAILAMSLLDFAMKDTYTQKLNVQDDLVPTQPSKRGWFINPMGMREQLPVWVIFASIIPAFLIFILLFMEVQITEMILNKKERKLQKGSGFHVDQFIMGLLTFVCALFGLPWMCAATVRTMAHVSALSSYSKTHAPGEKPHLIGVKEQRITNFAVHLFIGLSLTLGPVLRAIPVMSLFGVFLYLGVSSMSGVQMFERIKLLLMPVKYHPSVGYVRRVKVLRMHLFTVIQLVLLLALLAIKSTQAALIFPFALILLMPIRHRIINRIFTPSELHELDKEEEDSELEDEDDPDFYQMAHMPI